MKMQHENEIKVQRKKLEVSLKQLTESVEGEEKKRAKSVSYVRRI